MTAQYASSEIERLVREARELVAAAIPPHPPHLSTARSRAVEFDRLGAINGMIDRYAAMADQLEAARSRVDELEAAGTEAESLRRVAAVAGRYVDVMRANCPAEVLNGSLAWTALGLPEAVDAHRAALAEAVELREAPRE